MASKKPVKIKETSTAPKPNVKKMSSDLFDALRRRYRSNKSARTTLNSTLDEIDHYTGPIRDQGSTATNPTGGTGENLETRSDIWDFTAIDGREKLAASIHGTVTNPAVRWLGLSARSPDVAKDNECAKWLDDRSEEIWNDIQDSDFNVEISGVYHELAGNGNGFLSIEMVDSYDLDKDSKPIWEGIDFQAIPTRESFFEPDRKNFVKTYWRRYDWVSSQIMDLCEEKEIECPEQVTEANKKGSTKKWEVVFCVFRREDIYRKSLRKGVVYPAAEHLRPFGCVWWLEDTGEQLGPEGGYYENPIVKGVWSKTAGSRWGHGPSNVALPTVKYVNGWKELLRNAGETAVQPPIMAENRNIMSDVDLKSAGLTIVQDIKGIVPFVSGSKFDIGEEMLEKDQAMIRRLYHADELQLKDSPAMTASEAQIRYELMNRILGQTLTFIQQYILGPVILTILSMRMRIKACPPMPKKLQDAGGLVNIEYQGPLARSQRTDEVAAIERGATFVAGLSQIYPEVKATIDPLEAVKLVFNRLGIPASIMPPDSLLRKKMADILQGIQQAQQADTAAKQADANNKNAQAKATATAPTAAGGPGAGLPTLPEPARLSPGGGVIPGM